MLFWVKFRLEVSYNMEATNNALFAIGMIFAIISIFFIPFIIYEHFAGYERAEKLLEKMDIPIKSDTLSIIAFFSIMISAACFVLLYG